MSEAGYRFLDCGGGRRLEEFGGVIVSRPAPAADFAPGLDSAAWSGAQLAFSRERGWEGDAPADWHVQFDGDVRLSLRPAAAGQVGAFPEHAAVADETARRARELFSGQTGQTCSSLNLFAHTGLLTLRLARLGIHVAHVDAAKAAVRAARENAALSGLEQAPVRWLVDDAAAFMQREARRGKRYSLIAADPPSFGRAEKGGREWKFDRDIGPFLSDAAKLFSEGPALFCLTCHSGEWTPERLAETARESFPRKDGWTIDANRLTLRSAVGGKDLPAGMAAYAWRA